MPPRPPRVLFSPPRPAGWPEWLPSLGRTDGAALVSVNRPVTADEFRFLTARRPENAFVFRSLRQTDQRAALEPSRAAIGPLVQLKGWFGRLKKRAMKHDQSFLEEHSAHIVPFELYLGTGDAAVRAARSLVSFQEWIKKTGREHSDLIPLLRRQLDFEQLCEGVATTEFIRFDAPLSLLLAAMRFNSQASVEERLHQLYIAQAPLSDMPKEVQLNVPTPECLLTSADVYNTSLWLGLEPTFTPWHRDPNPNLFYQIYGTKEIRLMEPARARQLFTGVMQSLGTSSTPNLRGSEIMQGPERQAFVDAIWSPHTVKELHKMQLFHLTAHAGDVVFIPKGWWHSVRSKGPGLRGTLNVSVNWWFRWRASAMSDVVAPDSSEQNPQSPDQPSSGDGRTNPDPKPNEAHPTPPGSSTD